MNPWRPRVGDIGFSSSPGLIQDLIRFFTFSRLSHSFMFLEVNGSPAAFEAGELNCQVVSYWRHYVIKSGVKHWVYRPTKATPEQIHEAAFQTWVEVSGIHYAWLQLPWFVAAYVFALLTMRRLTIPNPFGGGVICAELVWIYLVNLGGEYKRLAQTFDKDQVNAQDLETLFLSMPDLFDLVHSPGMA